MLRSAIDSAGEDDGWANLAAVGKQVGNQASFDSRNYGYRKLRDLIRATDLFELRQDEQAIWVRDKPRAGAAAKAPAPITPASTTAPAKAKGKP
ncbi:OST-HTH/LOTUS domain-containing protein, partial [Bacillus sp. SIMBA_074]|uniref:OST-HTH/LOTUS domain-containing protein n=1 Tax=Bacillus sp. SIMBA_074 TaxID=3085812 RepID=UPI00397C3A4E